MAINWFVISREHGADHGVTRFRTNRSKAHATKWLRKNADNGRDELVVAEWDRKRISWPAPFTAETVMDDRIEFIELAKKDPKVAQLAMLASRLIADRGEVFEVHFHDFLASCGSKKWADGVTEDLEAFVAPSMMADDLVLIDFSDDEVAS